MRSGTPADRLSWWALEDERVQKASLTDQIECRQREFNQQSKQLAGDEQKLNYMQQSQGEKRSLVEMKQREKSVIESENEQRKGKQEILHEQLQALQETRANPDDDRQWQSRRDGAQAQLEQQKEALDELRAQGKRERNRCAEAEQALLREKQALDEQVNQLNWETMEKESKMQSLQAINEGHQDQEQGTREFLQNFHGRCSLFADLIKCAESDRPGRRGRIENSPGCHRS